MRLRLGLGLGIVLAVAGCEVVTLDTGLPSGGGPGATAQPTQPSRVSSRNSQTVVNRMEPVGERICRNRTSGANCDFRITVDTRPGQAPNASQSLDPNGRPVITFNTALINATRNADELAFVLGHEAAHHIEGHIGQARNSALVGGLLGNVAAGVIGGDPGTLQNVGANLGARAFSKNHELEADSLGTLITFRAGYDPLVGAQFFNRIPDPGNRFLGTHPPNADRLKAVRRAMAGLR